MKPTTNTDTVQNKPGLLKANFQPQTVQIAGQMVGIGNFTTPPAMVTSVPVKTVAAGVSANPHHFTTQLANQNGVSGHVTTSQSHDITATSDLSPSEETTTQQSLNLANTKEKTPMCLINELARFNRITHQYTLVDEQGPAHKKTFFVKLQLGDKEEYSASGASIKKAQHAAAASALEKTEYKHPPPKPQRQQFRYSESDDDGSITPTVELNALAMKRGEPALYKNIENRNPQPMYYPHNYDFRGMYNQRYHYMRPQRSFYVSLKVGTREFIGEGISRQMARHNAARKALDILKPLPIPDASVDTAGLTSPVEVKKERETGDGDDVKSEISIVHEIALRHNLPVSFDVIRESGPPHMKNFVTQCIVGNFKTEAEGNSKKISKKRAAEFMLRELRNLPSLPQTTIRPKAKPAANKKKNRNLIKQMQKADPTYGVGINPISRLIQIQQAQKKKEPVYTLLAERGLPRRREFVMQVQVEDQTCKGVGPNKKLAKRHAAEAMLQQLGYNKPSPQPVKPAIKRDIQGDVNTSLSEKKVTFSDNTEESSQPAPVMNGQSRQMIPGLLVLPEGNRSSYSQLKGMNQFTGGMMKATNFGMRAELKLRDVCTRHNIEVKFDEFSGSNNTSEFLSRVVVASNPKHTLHGSGNTPEASRDAAALSALKILVEMGVVKEDLNMAAGDGPQIKG